MFGLIQRFDASDSICWIGSPLYWLLCCVHCTRRLGSSHDFTSAAFDDPATAWDVSYSGVQQLRGRPSSQSSCPRFSYSCHHICCCYHLYKDDATTIFGNTHVIGMILSCSVVSLPLLAEDPTTLFESHLSACQQDALHHHLDAGSSSVTVPIMPRVIQCCREDD